MDRFFPNYLVRYTDMFGIADRLRQIDDGYVLMYNAKQNRYEVHNQKYKGETLSLVCPYDRVDARLITLVRRTSAQRANEFFREVEAGNAKIEKENDAKILDNSKQRAKQILEKMLKK